MHTTFAIIVTFYPNLERLSRLIMTLHSSKLKIIIVDNTPIPLDIALLPYCNVIRLGENYGIAHAQNIGIQVARKEGARILVFFDQDSSIETGMIGQLTSHLNPDQPKVIGAQYTDERNAADSPFYKLNRLGYPNKIFTNGRLEPFSVDVRISSGTAITAVTFDVVGFMDVGLFLDYVDIEWCLRARAHGVPILVDPLSSMRHSIGVKTFRKGGLHIFVDSPTRTYYRMRNSILLARKRDVPFLFAAKEIMSEVIHQFLQIIFVEDRLARFKAYILGIWHGLCGVSGRKI